MFPRGKSNEYESDYGTRNGFFNEQQSEGVKAIQELRGFKTYLTRRLKEIRKSNRSLELYEQVEDIEFYMTVMADSLSDSVHGVEGLKSFASKIQEMQRKYPLSAPGDSGSEDEMKVTSSRSVEGDANKKEVMSESESWDDCIGYDEPLKIIDKSFHEWRIGVDKKEPEPRKEQPPPSYNEISWLRDVLPKPDPTASLMSLPDYFGINQKKANPVTEPSYVPQWNQEQQQHHYQRNYSGGSSTPYAGPHQAENPHWIFDQPTSLGRGMIQYPGNAIPRQPIVASTFIPGYGQINITTPLQFAVNSPSPQPFPYHQSGYQQVPMELHPNPCYDGTPQQQPNMVPPPVSPQQYAHHQLPFQGFERSRHKRLVVSAGRYGTKWARTSEEAVVPQIIVPALNDDENGQDPFDSSSTVRSLTSPSNSDAQQPFQRNQRSHPYRSAEGASYQVRRHFNDEERVRKPVKRVTFKEPKKITPKTINKKTRRNTSTLELRQRIEKDLDDVYKLGCKKGEPVKVDKPEREPVAELPSALLPPPPSPVKGDNIGKNRTKAQVRANKGQRKSQKTKLIEELVEELSTDSGDSDSDEYTATRRTTRRQSRNQRNSPNKTQRRPAYALRSVNSKSIRKQKQVSETSTSKSLTRNGGAANRLVIHSDTEDEGVEMQTPPPSSLLSENAHLPSKSHKKKQVKTKSKKRPIRKEDVERIIMKMKKKRHQPAERQDIIDPMERSMRTFSARTNENGGLIIGKHYTVVNTNLGKVDLGNEDKSGFCVKQEVKHEVDDMPQDYENDYLQNDPIIAHLLSMVEVKMECTDDADGEVNNAEGTEHQDLSAILQNEDEEIQVGVVAEEDNDSELSGIVISSVEGGIVVPIEENCQNVTVPSKEEDRVVETYVTEEAEIEDDE